MNETPINAGHCSPQELSELFLFEGLTEKQLDWLCRHGNIITVEPGWVYRQGDPADRFYVLLEGEVALTQNVSGDEVEIAHTAQRGAFGGAHHAYVKDPRTAIYGGSMRAAARCRFFTLPAAEFANMMWEWFPLAAHLLQGQFLGTASTQEATAQRERLLALGSLTAGLTHELNNPAAAGVRAAVLLRNRVWRTREKLFELAVGGYSQRDLTTIWSLQEEAVRHAARPVTLSALQADDEYEQLLRWFRAHRVDNGWDLAPAFVTAGLGAPFLDKVANSTGSAMREDALCWLNYTVETELLLREIEESTSRISALVSGVKGYTRVGDDGSELLDVHELLEATLPMFADRLAAITVRREYEGDLPLVLGHADELKQVWTNLIDNAVAAMGTSGILTLRTRQDGERVCVEIADTGPGIPEQLHSRIFEPFFTTKAVGEGTGIGLEVVARIVVTRHRGDVTLASRPGLCQFFVRLPVALPVTQVSTVGNNHEGTEA